MASTANDIDQRRRSVFDLENLDRLSALFTERLAGVGVIGILGVSVITVGDVLMRWLFNAPINGLNEATSLLLAIGIAACLPAGLSSRSNIEITFVADALPVPVQKWLKVLGALLVLLFVFLIAWRTAIIAGRLTGHGETTAILQLPRGPSLAVIAAVLALGVPVQLIAFAAAFKIAAGATSRRWVLGIGAGLIAMVVLAAMLLPALDRLLDSFMRLEPAYLALAFFGLMWAVIFLAVPLGAATGLIGLVGAMTFLGFSPALETFGSQVRHVLINDYLAVVPLFLLMGSFASVAGLSSDIYRLAYSAIGHLRGGLGYATILGCAGFGALTGSSLATSATIGKVALPEMAMRGYSRSLAAGTVAAGGTLGQLVPPSTVLVLYALLTEESIGALFVATIVPALLAAALYMAAVAMVAHLRREVAPAGVRQPLSTVGEHVLGSWQFLVLVGLVIGGLYFGIFTETEAASVGASGAFLVALLRGKINRETIWGVMRETTSTTALVYMLIFGASMFSFLIGITGVTDFLSSVIWSITSDPLAIVIIIAAFYLLLGTIMDSFAIMIITVPVFAPLVSLVGYDPIWWGIVTVCLVETGMISPPFGLNLFILKSIDDSIRLSDIYRGVLPFVAADIVRIVLLIAFPAIALWLPGMR